MAANIVAADLLWCGYGASARVRPDVDRGALAAVSWLWSLSWRCQRFWYVGDEQRRHTGNAGHHGDSDGGHERRVVGAGERGGAAGTSAGGVFVLPPDGGCGAMAGCDLWAQDCAAGSKCVAAAVCAGGDAKNSTICVPVAGQPVGTGGACVVEGDPLSGVDNCAPGSICWGLDADNVGICVAQCVGTPDAPACAGVGESCFIRDSDVEMICLEGCEPLAPGCGSGEVCVVFELDFFCLKTAGAAALHESCSFMKTCAAGLLCVASAGIAGCDQDAPGCCEGLCDRTVEPDPDVQCPGQACIPFVGGAFDDVGLCGPPP